MMKQVWTWVDRVAIFVLGPPPGSELRITVVIGTVLGVIMGIFLGLLYEEGHYALLITSIGIFGGALFGAFVWFFQRYLLPYFAGLVLLAFFICCLLIVLLLTGIWRI
jgi:hypothetical protein